MQPTVTPRPLSTWVGQHDPSPSCRCGRPPARRCIRPASESRMMSGGSDRWRRRCRGTRLLVDSLLRRQIDEPVHLVAPGSSSRKGRWRRSECDFVLGVMTLMRRMPSSWQFDGAKSMMRNLPPKWTVLPRRSVSRAPGRGNRRPQDHGRSAAGERAALVTVSMSARQVSLLLRGMWA